MATPIENLSSIDFKVLGYINKSKYVTKERIFKKFKKVDALEYRLELLCEKDYEDKGFIRDAVENSS
ncbi:MAG: hypothetical protein FWF32_07645, partial [Endomicrobia bacterium]|nr:hypothetical protein [Endomicrobiia bacterium]